MKKTLIVIIVCLAVAGTASAQFDSSNVRFVGNWPFGPANAVAYDEARDLLFLGSGGGVYVLDVSDPSNPVKLSDEIRTQAEIQGLFYDGDNQNLYLALGGVGLDIWNVSAPDSPEKLGSYNEPREISSVFISGSNAYILAAVRDSSVLEVLDITSPSDPHRIGSLELEFTVTGCDLFISGTYAYAAMAYKGMVIIDISNPTDPKEAGCFEVLPDDWIESIYISGSRAYIAERRSMDSSYLRVVDISTPSNPVEVGQYPLARCMDVFVVGSNAYVCSGSLRILDISNPANIQVIGSLQCYNPRNILVSNLYAYIADDNFGLRVVDVSAPENPVDKGMFDTPNKFPNYMGHVFVSNSLAYLSVFNELWIVDVSELSNPGLIRGIDSLEAFIYDVSGRYAYAIRGIGQDIFTILDLGDPVNPKVYSSCSGNLPSFCTDVAVSGSYAYVGHYGGLGSIDLSDLSNPELVDEYLFPGVQVEAVALSGSFAFLACQDSGLVVLDVSDPADPQLAASHDLGGSVYDIEIVDTVAYVATGSVWSSWLRILNISDPFGPSEIANLPVNSTRLHICGSYLYIGPYEFSVIDISDPVNPVEVGYANTHSAILDMCVRGPYIFTANDMCGLSIYQNTLLPGVDEGPLPSPIPFLISPAPNRLAYDVPGEAQLTLYSVDGRKVIEEKIAGKGVWEANTSLPTGVYFARLSDDGCSVKTKLVVIK